MRYFDRCWNQICLICTACRADKLIRHFYRQGLLHHRASHSCLARAGRGQCQSSLHLTTEGWPGWVGLGGWLYTYVVYLQMAWVPRVSSSLAWHSVTLLTSQIKSCRHNNYNFAHISHIYDAVLGQHIASLESSCLAIWYEILIWVGILWVLTAYSKLCVI